MTEFDTAGFQEAIKQGQPVVVDFWAPWCMPCKVFAPTLEQLSDDMDGAVIFGKVNIDEHGQLAEEYGITSIPTVIVFKNGQPVERMVGVHPRQKIEELVGRHV